MLLLYLALGIVTAAVALYAYFTRTFNYWKSRNVAGPEPVALFGNLKESTLRSKNIGIVFQELYNQFPNEKVVGIYRMTTPCLLLRDLDVIKHIMIKDFDVFSDRGVEFSKEGLGVNLFHADGDTWRTLRNRFTPIFTSGKLKNMLYLITERADKFSNYVEKLCYDQPEQEVHSLIQKYTMGTIAACAFGVDIDTLYDKLDTLLLIDKLILQGTYATELDMMFPGILKKLNQSLFPQTVKDFFYDLVKSVMTQRGGVPSNRKDFMDLLLELRQQGHIETTKRNDERERLSLAISEDVIAAQAFVFYVAGYETTATTVSFLLYELAMNPDIQNKLLAEIDDTLAANNGVVDYDTIKSMSYLDRVFDETLRKYPIVEPLQRNAKADYKIPGTDVVVKKGMTVLISPMGIQNDEKYFPKPHIFDPERFTPENAGKRHPCAYIPFGTGPRNCIGMRFARLQGATGLVKLLSKVRVEPSKNTPPIMEIEPKRVIVGPKNGIQLKLIPRKPVKS
ncbi:cytochrome P450 6B2 [Manduca sexta]|uniref:unspecific monooxygenase n=1 Tax=Manduca sexta TaxID=7130 RepID=D5L0M4_MANSE|nr:cytochrome P450 6B2 [Manduca sexta]ADE05579.1 cytochrome P450 6B46 [Manduca sexta]